MAACDSCLQPSLSSATNVPPTPLLPPEGTYHCPPPTRQQLFNAKLNLIGSWQIQQTLLFSTMSDVPPTTPFMKPEWVSICGECGDELAWRMCSKETPAGKPEFFCCKSCCVTVGCKHQCCRKHCLTFGGCHLKKHKLSRAECQRFAAIDPVLLVPPNPHHRNSMTPLDTPDSIQPTPDLETRAPTPILPHETPYTTLPPTSMTPATTRESSAGPSKLPVTHTKKELILQQQKTQDAEQRDLAWCAANTIHAYGWSKDGNEAEMFEVQNGFTYPQLWMTASILSALGLTAGEDGSSMLQYYNTARSRWINIIQGHVITLNMHHIFVRNIGVSVMPDFDTIFRDCNSSEAGIPNIQTNLQAEHAAVHNANNHDLLKLTSSKRLGSVIEVSSSSDDEVVAPGKHKTAARRQDQHGPTRSSPTGLTAGDPIDVDSHTWPRSFYTCEVADVFKAAAVDDGRSLKMKFADVYGPDVCFYTSTFSDHLKHWKAASPSSFSDFIEAGKTNDGLYLRFMKVNPAPGGEVKAVTKHLAHLRG
ncbi:hypothetical protein DFH29DRAFT_881119 [Suillus ampliporus]|nr:hypothetical protein DFH29DRAFT_881119 [Suillus ampliporus]